MAIKEGLGALGFGIFRDKLVNDKIFSVGTEKIDLCCGLVGDVGGSNRARNSEEGGFGFWEASISDNLARQRESRFLAVLQLG